MSDRNWRVFISLVLLCGMIIGTFTPYAVVAEPISDEMDQVVDPPNPNKVIVKGPFVPMDNDDLPPGDPFVPSESGKLVEKIGSYPLPKSKSLLPPPDGWLDPAVQTWNAINAMPATIQNWEGIPNTGVMPPDTDGQVGPNHYVQVVNSGAAGTWVRVWDKSGTELYDFGMDSLWPAGDPCRENAYGDPVVLYDQMADRWVLTQFIYPIFNGNWYECIAVSTGPNPSNIPADWHVYSFPTDDVNFPDYPKFGVWPDGYYMMAHQFANASAWAGTGVFVFDRDAMLAGNPATFQYIDLFPVNPNYGGMLPANLMGSTLPPEDSPNYFVEVDMDWDGSNDILTIFEAQTTWPTGFSFNVVDELVVAPFVTPVCGNTRGRCIDQPNTTIQLESIGDRLMMHAWYRNMGSYEVIVTNHTVNAGSNVAGIRWYEIRKDSGGSNWHIYQQGTYSPDSEHRWMGSIAMDHVGNIALGYSVSSTSTFPGIRYAGRLASDPLNTLPQAEAVIVDGLGFQTGERWGDYSAMSVDPVDDCTFWYTQEYISATGSGSWSTRVASFKYPNCTTGSTGTLEGVISESGTGTPIEGASIVGVSPLVTKTFGTTSNASGYYVANPPTETYTVTATMYGYLPAEVSGIPVFDGVTTTLDIALDPATTYSVTGVVTDGTTGWPLYASIDIDGYPGDQIWTDPIDGSYAISLSEGVSYTFTVNAFVAGYDPESREIGPLTSNSTEDFGLAANQGTCEAPGYQLSGGGTTCDPSPGGLVVGNVYDENFSQSLTGAVVENEGGYSATTVETSADPSVDDGFFTVFSPAGSQVFTATMSGNYGYNALSVNVVGSDTVGQNFNIPAGWLVTNPDNLQITIDMGISATLPLTISNLGGAAAEFEFVESKAGYSGLTLSKKPLKQEGKNKAYLVSPYTLRLTDPLAMGDMLFNIDAGTFTGDTQLLGVEFVDGFYWVTGANSSLEPNKLYKLDIDGNLVASYDQSPSTAGWGWIDLAYDGTYLYAADFTNIRQIDPTTGTTTGVSFPCPGTGCLALAYDPETGHFWTSYFDSNIFELDNTGTIINSYPNNLAIMGMAWDIWSPGGPYLWGWSQDGTPGLLASQIDPATGSPTGVAFQGVVAGGSDIAGGAGIIAGDHPDYGGMLVFLGLQQADSDMLVGYDLEAVAGIDIPWLSEDPITGTIPSSSEIVADITFDASIPEVGNTGVYTAELRVMNDTPYGPLTIPVTMTVNAPPSYGQIEGTVNSLGYCDLNSAALLDAEVVIVGTTKTITLTTDASGYYNYYFEASEAPLEITVSAIDHAGGTADGVSLVAGETTSQDFDLRLLKPCVSADPTYLEVQLIEGFTDTLPLNLSNNGAISTPFEVIEQQGNSVQVNASIPETEYRSGVDSKSNPNGFLPRLAWNFSAFVPNVPTVNYEVLIVTPDSTGGDISALLAVLAVYPDLNVTVWDNTSGNPTSSDMNPYDVVMIGNDLTWESAGLDKTVIGNAAADYIDSGGKVIESLYIQSYDNWGFAGRYMTDGYSPFTVSTTDNWNPDTITILDPTHPVMAGVTGVSDNWGHQNPGLAVGASSLATWTTSGYQAVAVNDNVVALNQLIFHGANWTGDVGVILHNAVLWLGGKDVDIPWLSTDPITGSLDADSEQIIDVNFDTITYTVGTYSAILNIESADPLYGSIEVPVTMTVLAPRYGASLTPQTGGQLGKPGEIVTYTMNIENTGNLPNTYTLSGSGGSWGFGFSTSTFQLDPGEDSTFSMFVTIPTDASDGDTDTITITASGSGGASDSAVLTTEADVPQKLIFLPTLSK